MSSNLNMGKNKIFLLETQDDFREDEAFEVVDKDLKSAVNKQYLNNNFLKIKGDDYDLGQKIIQNCEPYYDGLFGKMILFQKLL